MVGNKINEKKKEIASSEHLISQKQAKGSKPAYYSNECNGCKKLMGFVLAFNTGKGGGNAMLWQCMTCKTIAVTFEEE